MLGCEPVLKIVWGPPPVGLVQRFELCTFAHIPTAYIVANVEAAIGQANDSESVAAKAHINIIRAIRSAK